MKVLECFGEPILSGGQESFVFNTIQHIKDSSIEIDAYTPYSVENEYYLSLLSKRGGSIYSENLPFNPGGLRLGIIWPLMKFLKSHHYDVVHIHSGSISVLAFASFAAKLSGVHRIIVHSHATGMHKTLKYRMTKLVLTPMLDVCPTHYFACSAQAGAWKYSKNVVKNKLVIVNNGVDLAKYQFSEESRLRIREKLSLESSNIVIGHVGRFSEEKNQAFLVSIMKALVQLSPEYRLLFVGDGELKQRIMDRVQESGLNDYVLFVGNVTNVNEYMAAMDVIALPSFHEGLPIVGIEAQAAGLHMIASSNVPSELNITKTMTYIDLNDNERWIEQLMLKENHSRFDKSAIISDHGYDIKKTAGLLRKAYLGEL